MRDLLAADRAMYEAKASGRDAVRLAVLAASVPLDDSDGVNCKTAAGRRQRLFHQHMSDDHVGKLWERRSHTKLDRRFTW